MKARRVVKCGRACGAWALALASLLLAARVEAYVCALNMAASAVGGPYLFPNWTRAMVGSFTVTLCDPAVCTTCPATEIIRGLTVFNFGSATNADITGVYWECVWWEGKTPSSTGLIPMNYAGVWSGNHAWIWSGSSPDVSGADVSLSIRIYANIASCPTDGATVQMGFPANATLNPTWPGSFYDNCGCTVPWANTTNPAEKQIRYIVKETDQDRAAPGDTINYTIYYGRPGAAPLSSITIIDTQPMYTHLVPGSSAPPPDPGWDPNPGPPPVLRWIRPGGSTTGGPTDDILFSASVDWGNGEGFEPGSGDVAAPEGYWLNNQAQAFFGDTDCPDKTVTTPPSFTVVKRYLFWLLGDNDLLFAPAIGQPDDEIIYSVFIKNISSYKTWWDVRIWDTVPAELDVWGPGYGFNDLCVGWTMTPTGCAAAQPGSAVSGGNTILTWRLDLPPSYTIDLRWKARIKGSTAADTTALNRISILAMGRTGIVDGTGHSGNPANFVHLAPIVLRTSYTSYVSWGASWVDKDADYCCEGGVFIHFFPPNKMTNFELRKREYEGPGNCNVPAGNWASDGGVSASINVLVGTCTGGYPEGGTPGCKAERAPSTYWPGQWIGVCPSFPSHFLYKVTSNCPVIWQMMKPIMDDEDLGCTYTGSTTNTFAGYMHYTYIRQAPGAPPAAGYGDVINIVNTDPLLATTVHIFKWDPAPLEYEYQKTGELGVESQWMPYDRTSNGQGGYLRIISSDGKLVIRQTTCTNTGDWGTNFPYYGQNAVCPTGDSGLLTSPPGAGPVFYAFLRHASGWQMSVGNVGWVNSDFEVYRYVPYNQVLIGMIPPTLSGSAGQWVMVSAETAVAGLNPPNAYLYGSSYDQACRTGSPYLTLYKVVQKSGGGLQVISGGGYSPRGGGAVLHESSGTKGAGTEFWFHSAHGPDEDCGWSCPGCNTSRTVSLDFFAPKTGTAIRMVSNDGYTSTYTTTGPDQCVAFRMITGAPLPGRRNWKANVLTGNSVTALYSFCAWHHKFYTAPFMTTGVYYQVIAPPLAYLGQSFWITIIVQEVGGGTKTDYAGVTSFTSTDPGAKLEATSMSGYDYDWQGAGAENGVRLFVNVSMTKLGLQTIVATDTEDGSITGLTTIMIVAADVKLSKSPPFTIASSGEQIQFRVCWSNYSGATAANFVITDAVPMGTSYVPEAASLLFCGAGGPASPTVTVAYGTASATTPGTFNTLTSPTQTAPASTRWLRWTIQDVYVYSTGCVCFRVRVD